MAERPDHDDFWLMSEVVLDLDAAADDKIAMERIIGGIDLASLAYMSTGRVVHGLGMVKANPVAAMGGCWIDGFMAGLNFQKRRAGKAVAERS